MAKKLRKWTPEKIQEVLDYRRTHKWRETLAKFHISGGQLHVWQTGVNYPKKRKVTARGKANGAAANGLAQLPEKDALIWLERWRQAYFDRMKAETPSAASVLAALRGGK